MKKKIIISGPALSRSGYGDMARFAIRSLKQYENYFDIYVNITNWGATGNLAEETEDTKFIYSLLEKTQQEAQKNNNQLVMDISLQITIPNEWKKMAAYNIGYTAGIETNMVSPAWLQPSMQMDKIIVISEHAKSSFVNSVFSDNNGNNYKITTPIDVCHFPDRKLEYKIPELDLRHDFNFLLVAQWGPRKNVEQAIFEFINEFKEEEVGLVLKVNQINDSIIDRNKIHNIVNHISSKFPDKKCSIYVLHGSLNEKEMQGLYRHPKIKAILSTTHGEGFGFPLFDASLAELPVVATDWSGHLDFLSIKKEDGSEKKMFAKIDFELKPVLQEHVWPNVIEQGTSWAFPSPSSVRLKMREVYKDTSRFISWAKKLAAYNKEKFLENKVNKKFAQFVLGADIVEVDTKDLPLVSLFASVYNADEFIEQYLEDITRQTIFKEKCELILVNPNSPGNEETVIKQYMEKFPNIKYFKLDSDPGVYDTWNFALKQCSGEFVSNANLDDRKAPWSVEKHAKSLFANKDVDLVYADSFILHEANKRWEDTDLKTQKYNFEQFSLESMLRGNPPHNNPMWRKSLHEKYGWFDQKYKSAGDWDFWLKCAFEGSKFLKINEVLGVYYHNPKGVSTNPEHNSWKRQHEKEIFKKYMTIYQQRNP